MAPNDYKHPRVVGFQLIERIGGGGFSTVYKAVNFESHRVAACKVIPLTDETTSQDRKALEKEIRVHAAMKHMNVLEFLNAAIVENDGRTKYFPAIYMLMELASGGDLFDKIAPEIGVDEELAHFYFSQLVAGVNYIHQQGVCHRDLKPENLLLDVAGRLKISDFGLCSVFKHKETGRVRLLTERCGSLPYVAPELSFDEPYEAEPVDIWGMGVILFTLLVGNTPWDEPTGKSHEFRRYIRGEIFSDDPWNRIGEDPLSLVKGILHIDPRNRINMQDIMAHHWVMRPSQVAREGQAKLAQRLTQSLQDAGDMEVIDPHKTFTQDDYDGDEDTVTASYHSQFTQSLLLFSQTQSGMRYTPHLTRFYAKLTPNELMDLIVAALAELGVKSKSSPADPSSPERLRLRIGGFDRRKEVFKGWVEVEPFQYHDKVGTFCVLQRDQGNPISWRQLWKSIVQFPTIDPHVFKRS